LRAAQPAAGRAFYKHRFHHGQLWPDRASIAQRFTSRVTGASFFRWNGSVSLAICYFSLPVGLALSEAYGHACAAATDASVPKVKIMNRAVLDAARFHPNIRAMVTGFHAGAVSDVQAAIAAHDVVVVGMRQNPFPKRARKALDAAGVQYRYLEYGSYFSRWKQRLALKMWSGWPTLPMVFVKGVLVGGATDLEQLIKAGELSKLLSEKGYVGTNAATA
jgi:glutaredoxin-related protein